MNNLHDAARHRVERRVKTVTNRIGEQLSRNLPGRLQVETGADHVAVTGPRLGAELLRNPDLRAIGYLIRGVR